MTREPVRPLQPEEAGRVAAARLAATRLQPYLAAALFAMQPVAAPGLGTFAVDRHWRLYIDPAVLDTWSVEQTAGVLIHEVGHLIRDHASRAEHLMIFSSRDRHRWNIATDLAINDDLIADRLRLPDGALHPDMFKLPPGLSEESYFRALQPDPEPADAHGPTIQTASATKRGEPYDCGSGSDGSPRRWELPSSDPTAPALNPATAQTLRVKIEQAVLTAGHHLGSEQRSPGETRPSHTNWKAELRAAIRQPTQWQAGRTDTTWHRPSRRHNSTSPEIVLPGTGKPRLELAIIVDTSGSVTDAQLAAAIGEIGAIRRQAGAGRFWLITCDTKPSRPIRATNVDNIILAGGGGTDLRPAMNLLPTLRPRPNTAVVLTDGHTPWPARPPHGITVIVATTDRRCCHRGFKNVRVPA